MNTQKISNNQDLDEILLVLGGKETVRDLQTKIIVPHLCRREFSLSVPYRIRDDGKIVLARYGFGSRDLGYEWNKMDVIIASQLTEKYFLRKQRTEENVFAVDCLEVNPEVYETSQPALVGRGRLNAFKVAGVMYFTEKAPKPPTILKSILRR